MARPRKAVKAKEPVRIRQKRLKGGNASLYLDIYSHGVRKYEFLGLYLIPELTPADRARNSETMARAEMVKSERILQLQQSGIGKWEQIRQSDIPLADWMERYARETGFARTTIEGRRKTLMHLVAYLGESRQEHIRLSGVTKDFLRGFIAYLRTARNRTFRGPERAIRQNTAYGYQQILAAALNRAVSEGLIPRNPFNRLAPKEKIPMEECDREFLTIDELKRLAGADCPNMEVKRAFMFSCFTGLRISDIRSLTRERIHASVDGKGQYVDTVMQKTGRKVTVPLSKEALQWLPKDTGPNEPLFRLPTPPAVGSSIRKWCWNAGIDKSITFHCSRHTFGTMMLTVGADLYTTSKLMGHANVATTTIYAKIIDKKKVDSIHLLDHLFDY